MSREGIDETAEEEAIRTRYTREVFDELELQGADLSREEIGWIVDFIIEEQIEPGSVGIMLAVKGYRIGRRVGRSAGRGDRP